MSTLKHFIAATSLCVFLNIQTLSASSEVGSVTYNAPTQENSFTFSPEQAKHWFIGDFIRWAVEDGDNIPRREAVLAVGSSSMRMWKTIKTDLSPAEIVHRGFGGSKMSDILVMMNFFQRYECATVLVYEGDNDLILNSLSVETYVENCQKFIEAILATRADTHIYFISTKPSPSRERALAKYQEANRQIEILCSESEQLHYIDVFTPMMVDENTVREDIFRNDRLHMNDKGYEIWTKAVRQALNLQSSPSE